MKVWYLDNEDCSGIFSSLEKAIKSFYTCAERCEWVVLQHDSDQWGDIFYFAWKHPETGCWKTDSVIILEYNLDEDNGG